MILPFHNITCYSSVVYFAFIELIMNVEVTLFQYIRYYIPKYVLNERLNRDMKQIRQRSREKKDFSVFFRFEFS